ncbi:MAG TPA: TatD family hydrolase [Dehalococcoidia bacterium]|nr:TatD family hydrolase [Dehalococcoidia bacterium]
MTPLIDTHSHPQTRPFTADRAEVLRRAREAGVGTLIIVGFDTPSSRAALDLAHQGVDRWATAGIHPHDAAQATPDDWRELERMAEDPKLVAFGEMGLDFFRNLSPHDVQQAVFQRQLDLCAHFDLPAVVHSRDAEEATWAILEPWCQARRAAGAAEPFGVMHCYAYGPRAALRYVEAGFCISIPGTVTYRNNVRGQEVAQAVPDGSFVLETDCPYLTPQSRRGKRNEPAYIVETQQFVARLRGVPPERVAEVSTAAARRLFRLDAAEARLAAAQSTGGGGPG